MTLVTGARTGAPRRTSHATRRRWPEHWPLSALIIGYPLWWLLGLASFMPILLAVPMLLQLRRRLKLELPRGIGFWLLFLAWVVASVFTLYVAAPGAVEGGGLGRLMVFGYRLAWYLTCTVALLWIVNTDAKVLPSRQVTRILGSMFVIVVGGGLLGVLWPTLDFPSLLELVLPGRIGSNTFVHTLIHPGVADIQDVLGHPEARPKAPFSFANAWGANVSMYLPFFVAACFRATRRWQRIGGALIMLVAIYPVVHSLNRGLWAALGLGAVILVLRQVVRGRVLVILASTLIIPLVVAVFAASPLGDMVNSRMEHQHSNDRRLQLAVDTVESTLRGSPVVGYGSTRDVQGSFSSIAGGSTPQCQACGVPPLGTQGQLWLVIFTQGFGGMLLYLAFLVSALSRSWRCRTTVETICTCLLAFSGLEMFVYGAVGMPLFALMIAIGLVWREQRAVGKTAGDVVRRDEMTRDRVRRVRRGYATLAVFVVLGGVGGLLWSAIVPQKYSASVSLLLAQSPAYVDDEPADGASASVEEITIDTEAAMVMSDKTISKVSQSLGRSGTEDLRNRVRIIATPNTRVLTLSVSARTPESATSTVDELARAYLDNRQLYLDDRRHQVVDQLRDRVKLLNATSGDAPSNLAQAQFGGPTDGSQSEERAAREALNGVLMSSKAPGEVIRRSIATPIPRDFAVRTTSGALAGLLAALVVVLGRTRTGHARLTNSADRQRARDLRVRLGSHSPTSLKDQSGARPDA